MQLPERPLIAVVDDEDNIRATLEYALKREGYRVQVFSDGLEAWETLKNGLPALVILDIIMPGLDGLDLCRKIRAVSERIPLIFLTSRDEEIDRVLGLELGADDYLCKPFSIRNSLSYFPLSHLGPDAGFQHSPGFSPYCRFPLPGYL